MRALLLRYHRALLRAPLRTNIATGVPLMLAGDLCAQSCEKSKLEDSHAWTVDAQRSIVMATYSGIVFTPIFHYVYILAEKLIHGPRLYASVLRSVFVCTVGGIPANALFLMLGAVMEMRVFGRAIDSSVSEAVAERVSTRLPELVLASYLFWVPVDAINFLFAPAAYRVAITCSVAFCWNCFLSVFQHDESTWSILRPPSCGAKKQPVQCMEKVSGLKETCGDEHVRECITEVLCKLDARMHEKGAIE
eukprot:TRINITY_DN99100_c0_g1_i1.p1 TRINITY_DN99100_c0_g1~~TRINITY_DN99100_c0_g1_i1.p1  ORF type:complete len:264 (+),score=30.51 TRINITY_DN99100_c0_g1_i1:46-792(+)